jgi:hypothetical protein
VGFALYSSQRQKAGAVQKGRPQILFPEQPIYSLKKRTGLAESFANPEYIS